MMNQVKKSQKLKEIVLDQFDGEAVEKKRKSFKSNDLNIRFCPEQEILHKKKRILMLKTQFAIKIKHLKSVG